jgi:hypothetical protein
MPVLLIEHQVPNYNGWKKAFDSDPLDRKKSGVKSYTIFRDHENAGYVMVTLEFEKMDEAASMLERLRKLWNQVEGTVMIGGKARIVELVEEKEY